MERTNRIHCGEIIQTDSWPFGKTRVRIHVTVARPDFISEVELPCVKVYSTAFNPNETLM